jgi:hypothetical protein
MHLCPLLEDDFFVRTTIRSTVFGLAVATLTLTGCTFITPIATQDPYDPSDGVGADLGELALRNILLIANDDNEATLVMTVVNNAPDDVVLNLQYGDANARVTESVPLDGGEIRTRVGDDPGTTVVISDETLTVGALFPIYAEYGDVPGQVILVPVLDGTLPEYELYVP